MSFTGEDRLKDALMPAIRASRPREQLLLNKAVGRAVTEDGYINPPALLPGSSVLVDFDSASNTVSSSDTVDYAEYLAVTFTLPDGVWRLKAMGGLTGTLSGSSNLNSQIWLNSDASTNFQIPLDAGDAGTVWPRYMLDEVQGDVTLALMFRPSAGTATIEAGYWLYRAERIR